MLAAIARDGRTAVERYARDLDGWRAQVVLGEDDFAKASRSLSPGVKDDIAFLPTRGCGISPNASATRCASLKPS